MTAQPSSISLETFTRRAVRAWWTDGLWDFAVTGFFAILAGWSYILIRIAVFPTWTWPWPFITDEVVNPMQTQFTLWMVAIIPVSMAYMWLAYKGVGWLKEHWLASRQGFVRHPFFLNVETRFAILYLGLYLGVWVVLGLLSHIVTGTPRWLSLAIIASVSAVTLTLGVTYTIRRYVVSSIVGLVVCTGLELFATTTVEFMQGPRSFFDVSGNMGNPAIPLIVWAVLFAVTGLVGLVSVLRSEPAEGAE